MVTKTISGIHVKAITAAYPSEIIGTDIFSSLYGEKEVARVVRGTRISSVRSAKGMNTSDMISSAAEHLLGSTDINRNEIDGLVVVTQTPDDWSPGCAFAIHQKLNLDTNCLVMDINAGCAGYVNGIIQAASLVASGACTNVLLCTGDINTRLVDDDDYKIRMLFGDAASATLITSGTDSLDFIYGADGSGRRLLGVPLKYEKMKNKMGEIGCLKMDGAAVMSFAIKRVPEIINALLDEKGINKDEINLYAMHQPNAFILNYITNILGIDPKKLPIDVNGIGTTNSSSIPLLLSRRNWQEEPLRQNIILCGFGVGLSWNALYLDLSHTNIIKPKEISFLD
jgi:3-oxoacyl-[acyl-carrier-protein] synthase-3